MNDHILIARKKLKVLKKMKWERYRREMFTPIGHRHTKKSLKKELCVD